MNFTETIKEAINHCLVNGIAFVAYRLPGEDIVFFADNNKIQAKSSRHFIINSWNMPATHNIIIRDCVDAASVFELNGETPAIELPGPTNKTDYIKKVSDLIGTLKVRGGKTVISRTLTNKVENPNWAEVAKALFESFPRAFCHIYYTPKTGAWMGATPEVLLKADSTGAIITMALAGTHSAGTEWDDKNRREQQMVTDFIRDSLAPLCSSLIVHPTETLNYGKIEHLCSRFEGILFPNVSPLRAMEILSPTPAVAGLPREAAIKEIEQLETHKRGCYSGYIAVADGDEISAYVNLRCVKFTADGNYCLYAGGGITADSNAESEWTETNSKLASLYSIINR